MSWYHTHYILVVSSNIMFLKLWPQLVRDIPKWECGWSLVNLVVLISLPTVGRRDCQFWILLNHFCECYSIERALVLDTVSSQRWGRWLVMIMWAWHLPAPFKSDFYCMTEERCEGPWHPFSIQVKIIHSVAVSVRPGQIKTVNVVHTMSREF